MMALSFNLEEVEWYIRWYTEANDTTKTLEKGGVSPPFMIYMYEQH